MCRKHYSFAAIVLALLLTSAACSSESPTGPESPLGEPVTFQKLVEKQNALPVQGNYGGYDFTERKNLVLQNEDDFASFWRVLHSSMTLPPARPTVDFSENVVVVVMQGTKPTGGYSIEVKDVTANEGSLRVNVEATSPGTTCVVSLATTSPYQIGELTRPATGKVEFNTEEAVRECDS